MKELRRFLEDMLLCLLIALIAILATAAVIAYAIVMLPFTVLIVLAYIGTEAWVAFWDWRKGR